MTLPSSGVISIQAIKTEYSQYPYNDLGRLGAYIIGRNWGNYIAMSEFRGLQNIIQYTLSFPPYPTFGGAYNFSFTSVHGPIYWTGFSGETSGVNYQELGLSQTVAWNPVAWAKFIRADIPWFGSFSKAFMDANGYGTGMLSPGNFSGGLFYMYFGG